MKNQHIKYIYQRNRNAGRTGNQKHRIVQKGMHQMEKETSGRQSHKATINDAFQ